MKKSIKRGLAIAAVAPLAFAATAGTAFAYQETEAEAVRISSTQYLADCDFGPENDRPRGFDFEVIIGVDSTYGDGRNDVNYVKVIAPDEDNDAQRFERDGAEVEAMRVTYEGYTDNTLYSALAHSGTTDGQHKFRGERDNVDTITVRVRWDEWNFSDEDRVAECEINLPIDRFDDDDDNDNDNGEDDLA